MYESFKNAEAQDISSWQMGYTLQAIGYFTAIGWVAAFILIFIKKKEVVNNPFLYSHATWQLNTMAYGFFWILIAGMLVTAGFVGVFFDAYSLFFFVGAGVILVINYIWVLYRIIKGWLLLREGKPAPFSHL